MTTAEQIRDDVRSWLAENWDPERPKDQWRTALVESGWAAPTWPCEWFGRGLPTSARHIVREEFAAAGARGTGEDVSNLYANTILAHGTDDQKREFLRPLLLGETRGCLLYSEPGAGSDLAALQTRADRDGDGWVVTGQKVWTSGAKQATHGMLVARTDWDVPKHRGITFFWFPMIQDGVEVRPIKQVTGGAEFNEVFFAGARVPDSNRLGDVNAGWRTLQTALGYERLIMGGASSTGPREVAEPTPEQARIARESPWTRKTGGADYIALAREKGRNTDPVTRQAVARLYTYEQVNRWNALRARASSGTDAASSLASVGKLAMSRIVHTGARLTADLLGPESLLDGADFPVPAEVNRSGFAAFVTSIGGGTDQVQRNIIGERVLGLPKEPELDRDVAFRDVRKAAPTRRFG